MINTDMSNPKTYYSPYGYVEVEYLDYNDRDNEMIRFRNREHRLCGTIRKINLTDHLVIHFKTFHGSRRIFTFEVNIYEKLCDIFKKICMEEDKIENNPQRKWNIANQYRMLSSLGLIKELNPHHSYIDGNLKNFQTILILNQIDLAFNNTLKGNLIHLESNNRVAFKQGGDEHQFSLGTVGYSQGKHYFEVILETEPYEKSVIIGLSLQRTEFNLNPAEAKGLFGYVLSDCKKVSHGVNGKVEFAEYGDITKLGDRVGVLMEFNNTGLDISFFINKINMGVAFKSLPINTYYPAVVLGFDGTRVSITNNIGFPDV